MPIRPVPHPRPRLSSSLPLTLSPDIVPWMTDLLRRRAPADQMARGARSAGYRGPCTSVSFWPELFLATFFRTTYSDWVMGKLLRVVLVLALISAAGAANRGPSTAEEKARLLKASDLLRNKPLTPEARKEGLWALQFTTDVPDINVAICGSFEPAYRYDPQLMASDVVAMGAFIVKNPKKAADQNAVWRAGVDAMLATYQS